jgi:hypothetical protein
VQISREFAPFNRWFWVPLIQVSNRYEAREGRVVPHFAFSFIKRGSTIAISILLKVK